MYCDFDEIWYKIKHSNDMISEMQSLTYNTFNIMRRKTFQIVEIWQCYMV